MNLQNNDYEDVINLYIEEHGVGERIDKFLSDMLSSYSRSHIQKLISDNLVLVNNKNNAKAMLRIGLFNPFKI